MSTRSEIRIICSHVPRRSCVVLFDERVLSSVVFDTPIVTVLCSGPEQRDSKLAMAVPPRGGTRLAGGRRFACAALALALVAISPARADYTYVSTSDGVKHPCAPQHHVTKTTEAFHSTSAQAMVVDLDVNSCEAENADGDVRSSFVQATDLDAVSGKIAVVQAQCVPAYEGGDSSTRTRIYYLEDFQRRWTRWSRLARSGSSGAKAGLADPRADGRPSVRLVQPGVPVRDGEGGLRRFRGLLPGQPGDQHRRRIFPPRAGRADPQAAYILTVEEPGSRRAAVLRFPCPAQPAFDPTAAVAAEDELVELSSSQRAGQTRTRRARSTAGRASLPER